MNPVPQNPPPFAPKITNKITVHGAEHLPHTTPLASLAYSTSSTINYLLQTISSPSARADYLPTYIGALLKAASLNGGLFIEAESENEIRDGDGDGDGQKRANEGMGEHVTVVIPPGENVGNPRTLVKAGLLGLLWRIGVVGCYRMLLEYEPLALASLTTAIPTTSPYHTKHYYIFFTSTHPSSRHRGLCTSVTTWLQQKAEEEKVPIWLEATTLMARDYFAKLGFEVSGEIVLGKGTADENGDLVGGKKGERERVGVKIWGMVWWPISLREGR